VRNKRNCLEFQDLLGMTHSIAQLQKHKTLFGGVANHGDVLQPVYCMLLALHTAGQSTHVRANLPSVVGSVQTAAAGLSDVASQPVIAAMLKTTLAVWSAPEAHDSSEVCETSLSLLHRTWWLSARPWHVPLVKVVCACVLTQADYDCCSSYRASTVTVATASSVTLRPCSHVRDEIKLTCRSWSARMGIAGATHS